MLPLRAKVNLGAIAIKGTSHSPNLMHYWSHTIKLFSGISKTLVGRWGVLLKLVYSAEGQKGKEEKKRKIRLKERKKTIKKEKKKRRFKKKERKKNQK